MKPYVRCTVGQYMILANFYFLLMDCLKMNKPPENEKSETNDLKDHSQAYRCFNGQFTIHDMSVFFGIFQRQ